jgi:hypothetical protein
MRGLFLCVQATTGLIQAPLSRAMVPPSSRAPAHRLHMMMMMIIMMMAVAVVMMMMIIIMCMMMTIIKCVARQSDACARFVADGATQRANEAAR